MTTNRNHAATLLVSFVIAIVLGTYLAFCDWCDERKARRSGYDSEGAE